MEKNKIEEIMEILLEIEEDLTIPKNMRLKIKETICTLKDCKDVEVTLDKTIQNLDLIVEDPNLPSYAKTQIWNAVSLLESKK